MLNVIPIGSKQISYLMYNDNTCELLAHYHTGEVKSFSSVPQDDYEILIRSENRYDAFVQLTGRLALKSL
ncbi:MULTISPECIES: hypothetical protein [unclassified Paenibacillus]|uniref:hypothetical protein n=1 Tax=unclassified Paenibacillus TaxID=185978 RepID=UPI001C10C4A3|nr:MULTISPECIES: hypothetical protein [unclassified Paenibacillus]MBU5444606.1 hypothetical protein [Paenibacillus sp. MSJ-34]CAH0117935.1 hypothetical protein PAE9249_00400 [Paenibacillus sp. CECT 9249]